MSSLKTKYLFPRWISFLALIGVCGLFFMMYSNPMDNLPINVLILLSYVFLIFFVIPWKIPEEEEE